MRPASSLPPLTVEEKLRHLPDSAASAGATAVAEPNPRVVCAVLTACAFIPRLALMPFNENLYGDAVVRTELGARWAANPHWLSSFADGAFQFGPLQIYLIGLALKLGFAPEDAGRVVSLIFGTLSVIPLFFLTRRLFDWKAGVWAALALTVCGIHLQFSTTAASESLALFLVLSTLALFAAGVEDGRFTPIAFSALVLNLACATRYDAWLFVPLLCAFLLFGDTDRVAAVTRTIFFGLLCLPFPLVWMQGNELALGDPFAPMHHIEQFHRSWIQEGLGRWGHILYRLQNLFFWPGVALVTLSPGVAIVAAAGMIRAWREYPTRRWLIYAAVVPAAYFTFRSAVLLNFQPLARFAATEALLLLPYLSFGVDGVLRNAAPKRRRWLLAATVFAALGVPLALGLLTFHSQGKIQDSLRPISPVTTNPPELMEVARFVKTEVKPKGESIILDADSAYWDLQIAFFGGLPEERMARYRWDTFEKRLSTADPTILIRIDGGKLTERPDFHLEGNRARLGDRQFVEMPGFTAPFHVYRRE